VRRSGLKGEKESERKYAEGHSVTYATHRDNKASVGPPLIGIRAKASHPLKFVSLLPFIALTRLVSISVSFSLMTVASWNYFDLSRIESFIRAVPDQAGVYMDP
jgi:hypothetical protein